MGEFKYQKWYTFCFSFGPLLCDNKKLPLGKATYNEIHKQKCNVFVVMRDTCDCTDVDTNRHKFAYGASDLVSKWVSFLIERFDYKFLSTTIVLLETLKREMSFIQKSSMKRNSDQVHHNFTFLKPFLHQMLESS